MVPRPPLVSQVRGAFDAIVPGCPHLMLADAGRHDRLVQLFAVAKDLPHAVDGILGQDGIGDSS